MHPGGLGSPLLSEALMYSHDGIVGTTALMPLAEPPGAGAFDAVEADDAAQAKRLAFWDEAPRACVLDFELMEGIGFWSDGRTAAVLCRTVDPEDAKEGTRTFAGLVVIRRPKLALLQKQAQRVRDYADLRPDRMAEIQAQVGDILSFFGAIDDLTPCRSKWTIELLATAIRFATTVEMRIKHALNVPRPIVLSPRIQPIIQTPGHGSLPSGHATESYAVATVLTHLYAQVDKRDTPFLQLAATDIQAQTQRYKLAARIAINRTVAGMHFPIDSAAGAVLGVTLGEYLVARARGDQKLLNRRAFDPAEYGDRDFSAAEAVTPIPIPKDPPEGDFTPLEPGSPNLQEIWRRAAREAAARWGEGID
jgi:membrane-associated phospholipid phosphatase